MGRAPRPQCGRVAGDVSVVREVATSAIPKESASSPFKAKATSNPSRVLSFRIRFGPPRACSSRQLPRACARRSDPSGQEASRAACSIRGSVINRLLRASNENTMLLGFPSGMQRSKRISFPPGITAHVVNRRRSIGRASSSRSVTRFSVTAHASSDQAWHRELATHRQPRLAMCLPGCGDGIDM
jgi:hypothetical protein